MENSMEIPQRLKIKLSYPEIPHLGIYPKKTKLLPWKDIHTTIFIVALFTTAKTEKPLLLDKWDKEIVIGSIHTHIHMNIYAILLYIILFNIRKRNDILPFVTLNMVRPEGLMLSEVRKTNTIWLLYAD